MSHEDKKVDWCLKKAKRELEECKKVGKQPKHRGLIKVEPNSEAGKAHIAKAERYLKLSGYVVQGGYNDAAVGHIFYAMYQCFLAIASKFGYQSRNQSCTIALMEKLKTDGAIDIPDKFLTYFMYEEEDKAKDSIIEMREEYTYGTEFAVEKSTIELYTAGARELIDIARGTVLG